VAVVNLGGTETDRVVWLVQSLIERSSRTRCGRLPGQGVIVASWLPGPDLCMPESPRARFQT
jgi:hypothetical protein